MDNRSAEAEAFEAVLLNEQLREGTIEERLAEFGLNAESAGLVREYQSAPNLRLLPGYLRHRGKAQRYFQKYGDYFVFRVKFSSEP